MTAGPTPPPNYKPGDVVNGHVLTDQGTWVPAGQPPPGVAQHAGQPAPGQPVAPPGQPGAFGAPVSPGATAQQQPKPRKPLWKRWWFILLGVIVLIAIFANLGGGDGDPAPPDEDPAAIEEPAEEPAEEEPAQEAPEEETATEPEAGYYAETYPMFEAVVLTGVGDSVLPVPAAVGIVTSTHDGSANFAINALDASNSPTGDLIVNTIGAYSGTGAFGLSSFSDATSLQVTADGDWSITIAPISAAPVTALPAAGLGDVVFLYDGDPGTWAITHDGDANIAVIQFGGLFPNLMVNDIGPYTGSVPVQAGPSVIVVNANGNWTITPQ